ncbi:polysaccharide deacetylase family protein [Polaromonas sp. UC242_47]|uniref:polysaccharide deacetylase family protein n=1 Tax=Polaromonas sp. UC242_47 TaxID=3374626 RepID=UPI0037AF20EE
MECQSRLVVFTGDLSYNVRRNIVDLDARVQGLSWLVFVHVPRKSLTKLLASQRSNLRKHGWRWIWYQVGELMARFIPRSTSLSAPDSPGNEYTFKRLQAHGNVRIVRVDDIHGDACLKLMRDFSPDLGLSLAAPILKSSLFQLPRLGTVNLHKGKLPDFRGMPPAFWELWTDQPSVGCSVHWVDERLDEGAVLAESNVGRERFSTLRGLQLRLDELGSSLVCEVVEKVLAGQTEARTQVAGQGKTYRKPTLAQQSILAARLALLAPPQPRRWMRVFKNAYARLALATHRVLLWRLLEPRVTVLLYHRVCDDARDNLSVGVAQFERQMRLLSERCDIFPIERVLELGEIRRSPRPLVAVTFDDGYLDNYLNAAPVLRRFSVPAAFFVSTGIVNSDRSFPHDQKRGNPAIPMLSWAQLREMRIWGFTIGSHTVNHINCVAEDEAKVRDELAQSQADLVRELGPMRPIFAYPYGGRHQMNAERLELVRDAGYVGCLSAFGGSNIGEVNRWRVLRRGIHWEFSDVGFLYQCLGY